MSVERSRVLHAQSPCQERTPKNRRTASSEPLL